MRLPRFFGKPVQDPGTELLVAVLDSHAERTVEELEERVHELGTLKAGTVKIKDLNAPAWIPPKWWDKPVPDLSKAKSPPTILHAIGLSELVDRLNPLPKFRISEAERTAEEAEAISHWWDWHRRMKSKQ